MKRTLMAAFAATVALPMMATSASAQQDYYAGEGSPPSPPYTPERYITDWDEAERRGRDGRELYILVPRRYFTEREQAELNGFPVVRYGPPAAYAGGRYGPRTLAEDRWAQRPSFEREFDRPSPPPGYREEWTDRGEQFDREERADREEAAYREGYRRGMGIGTRRAEERGYYMHPEHRRPMADDRWDERPLYQRGFDRASPMEREERAYDEGYRRGFDIGERRAGEFDRARQERLLAEEYHRDRDFRRDFRQDGRRGYYQDPAYNVMPRAQLPLRGEAGMRGMEEMRRSMRLIDAYDTDQDGRVTQEEIDQVRADRLMQFDVDEDEALSVEEYEELWFDAMRPRAARMFERYDRDADERVTVEEFSERTRDLVRRRDRDRDEALSARDFGMGEWPEGVGRPPEIRAPLDSDEPHVVRGREEEAAAGEGATGPTTDDTGTGVEDRPGAGAADEQDAGGATDADEEGASGATGAAGQTTTD